MGLDDLVAKFSSAPLYSAYSAPLKSHFGQLGV